MTSRAWIWVGVLVILAGVLFLWSRARGFLEGEEFQQLVEQFAGGAVRGSAEFQPFRWNGAHVESGALLLTGGEGSKIRSIKAENLRASIDWAAAFSGAWRLEKLVADKVRAEFGEAGPAPKAPSTKVSPAFALLPSRFEMGVVSIGLADLDFGDTEINGSKLEVRHEGHGWKFQGTGGRFVCPWLPPLGIESFQADWNEGRVSVGSSALRLGSAGKISATGKWPGAIEARWSDVSPADFPGGKWGSKLDGKLSGTAQIESGRVKGNAGLSGGVLRGFEVLDQAADFTGRTELRALPIQKASADFEIHNGEFVFRNVFLESAKLLQVKGSISVAKNQALSGNLDVGVNPSLVSGIPGARSQVFTREADGLVWTPVCVGGTLDSPTENLTSRLISAAGGPLLEAVKPVLQSVPEPARKAVGETINTLFDILGR